MQTALLIFIVLFALAIGFFLGLFLLSLNTPLTKSLTKKAEEVDQESDEASDQPDKEIIKPSPESHLILQIWQEEGQPPVYEQDGTFFAKEDLPEELLNVITIHEPVPEEPESTQPPIVEDEPAEPVADVTPAPVEEVPPAPVSDIPELDDAEEDEEAKMLSVVDEVNNILQRKLIGSPLAGKGIHLMENHNNEIRFWVGLNSYNDVEDIPDPEVRKIIDESVKEWERNRL
jgi:hypothetical protein